MRNLFALASLDLSRVDGIIIASVVPNARCAARRHVRAILPLNASFYYSGNGHRAEGALRQSQRSGRGPRGERRGGVSSLWWTPRGGGFGTTINFDVVSANAEYLGGMICPGIGMSISGLFAKTARLPMVDFREPAQLIGKNTVGSIQSGLLLRLCGHDRRNRGTGDRGIGAVPPRQSPPAGRRVFVAAASRLVKGVQRGPDTRGPGNYMAPQPKEVAEEQPGPAITSTTSPKSRNVFKRRARHGTVPDVTARLGAGGDLGKTPASR